MASYTYSYPKASITVDCVVFGLDQDQELKIMLIRRGLAPYQDQWALPGGFVRIEESLEDAARRELQEETGLRDVFLEQLYTFGEVNRDPRERVITIAYYALINLKDQLLSASTDAKEARWFNFIAIPPLGFDHDQIVNTAIERLRGKIRYEPIGFELLPTKFTLSEIQKLYEKILGKPLDKRNFRRKILKMELLIDLNELQTNVAHRAAKLYRFDEQKYQQLKQKGFSFEL
ncbi:MAG: NUDIX hydrolase [Synechococcaceae cyanobacterium RL_1_2]|nr:NUDIX hydrolase [Synechococcaceae cyanobacterium RL_1_2]